MEIATAILVIGSIGLALLVAFGARKRRNKGEG
jgi:LPXTG-motif cell wall-anchored protein